MGLKEIGIYIHIPFCKQKCYYCDFYSMAEKEEWIPRYIKSLVNEIKQKKNEEEFNFISIVKTIYIGGGTPSFINSSYITEILQAIYESYEIDKNAEITIEVNPGTTSIEKLEDYKKAGINRLSIGLQATQNHLLQAIGRIHNYYDFVDTYHLAREAGFKNINVDLMIGLPEQTILDVEDSLEEVISLEPEHISVYSLIVEENTKIQKGIQNGTICLPSEDDERKMYWKAKQILEQNGYKHYEISNFAKVGYESKHNMDCWKQKEYIGFGAAAHSYINSCRVSNIDSIEQYIKNIEERTPRENLVFHEKQTLEDKQNEYILLGLRMLEGVSIQEFKLKFVANPIYLYHDKLEKLTKQELIEIDGDTIRLTNKGLDFANIVWEEFV